MCGIAGVVTRDPLVDDHRQQARIMQDSLIHRGPDGEGEFVDSHLALVMRRLSIIDLTGGWQPLFNEDRSLALIANGEIYNFVELRAQLERAGHHFASSSDCETILHLYEDYGQDCVHHLRGMFAFALWDARQQRLLIARDRMGEKPVYLYQQEGLLLFASEIKALIKVLPAKPELDPVSIDLYFHYGYVPEPRTPLRGVRKLPAGHLLTVDVAAWQIEQRQYWSMADAPPLEGDPVEAIRAELDTISSIVIRSDVPVGIALSGGIDSSALAVLTAAKYPGTMRAFSIGYPGDLPNDERAEARHLADHLGIPFHDVELHTDEFVRMFPQLICHTDDPIADISGYGYYSVSRLAHEHGVPVLLQGQGGDELFWGYQFMREATADTLLRRNMIESPLGALSALARLPGYILPTMPRAASPRRWKHWIGARQTREAMARWQRLTGSPRDAMIFMDVTDQFQEAQAAQNGSDIYAPSFRAQIPAHNAHQLFSFAHPWGDIPVTMTRLISETYLLENGIAQGDRLSMASSVELRLPLVDYRLAEIVIGHRKTQPDHALPPKAWLTRALRDILPDWVLNRPKRGFSPPTREWYTALARTHGAALASGYLVDAGVIKPAVAETWAAGEGLMGSKNPLAFKGLVLEQWCSQLLS